MLIINDIVERVKRLEESWRIVTDLAPIGDGETGGCGETPKKFLWNTVYRCMNPDPVDNSECPEDDPYCKCPCQDLKPSGEEPTAEDLREALVGISGDTEVCDAIKEVLGEEYLGCMWDNPESALNCSCPCVGEKFSEYLEYVNTQATFWDTPKTTPLWRNAQMNLLGSQVATMVIDGDLSLRPGTIINVVDIVPIEGSGKEKRFSGNWMVTGISHAMPNVMNHNMRLTLQRDSVPISPDDGKEPESFWDWLL